MTGERRLLIALHAVTLLGVFTLAVSSLTEFDFWWYLKSGELIWRKKERSQGSGSVAITYADGHIYGLYQNGYMTLIEANGNGYREAAGFKVPNAKSYSWAQPVVLGGKLYLRQDDNLYCYDIK